MYGLTELNRSDVRSATLVANPGCYPTGAILALAPAVREGLIHEDIIIDAKSGVSGAGRGLSLTTHFSEVNENVSAYAVSGHRHMPEITQELRRYGGGFQPRITFLPHLIPMTRGILDSCYATLKDGAIAPGPEGIKELRALYESFYRDEPFVQVVGSSPMTKHTLGNNNCVLFPTVDLRTNRLMVISCLDNLVKGSRRAGHTEHEPDAWVGGDRGAGAAGALSLASYRSRRPALARLVAESKPTVPSSSSPA